MNKIRIKTGDNVKVISGDDKGKTGVVLSVNPKKNFVVVEGVNIVKKHKKARSAQDPGGIVQMPGNINASNVMIVCSTCNKATRISNAIIDGKKSRVCKKCGASLDLAISKKKVEKKEAKASKEKTKVVNEEQIEEKKKETKKKDEKVKNTKKAKSEKVKEKATEAKKSIKKRTKSKKEEELRSENDSEK